MLPEKLCHVEKMAPGTAAIGYMAKCVAASYVWHLFYTAIVMPIIVNVDVMII